jgi:hypothetical protein
MLYLFNSIDSVTLLPQNLDGLKGGGQILPANAVLGSEGSLMNLCMRRRGGNAAEEYLFHAESITGTQDTTDVVHRTHIIENNNKWKLLSLSEFLKGETLHFYSTYLTWHKLCLKSSGVENFLIVFRGSE